MFKTNRKIRYILIAAGAVLILPALTGCSGVESEAKYPSGMDRSAQTGDNDIYDETPSIFGSEGLKILGGKKNSDDGDGSTGIGVNTYLWRASLDTVSFMPLASADPFGGVIITEWYSPPETPDERFKLNVFILDKHLRSDGIEVKVFRQVRKSAQWRDAAVAEKTATQLEDAILTRARQMRVSQINR